MNCIDIKKNIDKTVGFDISTDIRNRDYTMIRSIYYYLCFKYATEYVSYSKIGKTVNKDHATIINGLKKFNDDYDTDNYFKDVVTKLENGLQPLLNKRPKEFVKVDGFDTIKLRKEHKNLMIKYDKLITKYHNMRRRKINNE